MIFVVEFCSGRSFQVHLTLSLSLSFRWSSVSIYAVWRPFLYCEGSEHRAHRLFEKTLPFGPSLSRKHLHLPSQSQPISPCGQQDCCGNDPYDAQLLHLTQNRCYCCCSNCLHLLRSSFKKQHWGQYMVGL